MAVGEGGGEDENAWYRKEETRGENRGRIITSFVRRLESPRLRNCAIAIQLIVGAEWRTQIVGSFVTLD